MAISWPEYSRMAVVGRGRRLKRADFEKATAEGGQWAIARGGQGVIARERRHTLHTVRV